MVLVAGATGSLGGTVCRMLAERGSPVRALVRSSSSTEKVAKLRDLGVQLALGDLRDSQSLRRACRGVDAVVATASATSSSNPADTIAQVDGEGQLTLVHAAQSEKVQQFVYVSLSGGIALASPLDSAKRAVEERVRASGMAHTILRPTAFADVWLSARLGFDAVGGHVTVFGSGEEPISFIALQDVARFCVMVLDSPDARNDTLELGGPEAVTYHETIRIAEGALGRVLSAQHVPLEALRAQYDNATDPLQKTIAALTCGIAQGDAIDMSDTLRRFPLRLRSVRDHFETMSAHAQVNTPVVH